MPRIHSNVSRAPLRHALLMLPLAAIGCGDGAGAVTENPGVVKQRTSRIEALQKKAGVNVKNVPPESPTP